MHGALVRGTQRDGAEPRPWRRARAAKKYRVGEFAAQPYRAARRRNTLRHRNGKLIDGPCSADAITAERGVATGTVRPKSGGKIASMPGVRYDSKITCQGYGPTLN